MHKKSAPIIEPINVRQYEFKQSDYEMADKLPFRSIVVSASQGGKGILIQNLVLKVYRHCFERIYNQRDRKQKSLKSLVMLEMFIEMSCSKS